MPFQVSWQSVAIKLQPSVRGLGAGAAAAGGAFVGTMSSAHTPTAHEVPATARTIAVKIRSLRMRQPQRPEQLRLPQHDCSDLIPVAGQVRTGTLCPRWEGNLVPVTAAPQDFDMTIVT